MYLVNFTILDENLSIDNNYQVSTSMVVFVVTAASSIFIFRLIRSKKDLETPNFKDSHR